MNYTKQPGVHESQGDLGPETDMNPGGINRQSDKLDNAGNLVICQVTRHAAGLYAYIVNGAGATDRLAVDAPMSASVLGARSYMTYPAGSFVLVWFRHPVEGYGHILSAMPSFDDPVLPLRGPLLHHNSPAGFARDNVHSTWIASQFKEQKEPNAAGVPANNNGRPWDVLGGDWGTLNEFLVGITGGKLSTALRAGSAEISVSAVDEEVRTSARAIRTESLTTESKHFCDQGEGSTVEYMTPYLYEGLGAFQPNMEPMDYTPIQHSVLERSAADERASYQPQEWDQMGIFRWSKLAGFLGDLFHEWISLPSGSGVLTHRTERDWPGLAEFHVGIDGFTTLRTAKGLLIQKTVAIPVPEERKQPWDPEGDVDDECDYEKEEYKTGEYEYDWNTLDPMARQQLVADHNAFRTGVSGVRHVLDHEKDWHLPDDADSKVVSGVSPISRLGTQFRSNLPTSEEKQVDRRRKKVRYYYSTSSILLADDGGIQLQGGYGEVISMTGGNIEISCPGDVIMRPGRSVIQMAPRDIISRAGRDAEVSAAKGDVRVKAEKNMHMLSGNGGTGGTLIENRATADSQDFSNTGSAAIGTGVKLKAKDASVSAWAQNVYLRSLGGSVAGNTGGTAGSGGRVVLDASGGGGTVSLIGNNVDTIANTRARTYVGTQAATGEKPTTYSFWEQTTNSVKSRVGRTIFTVKSGAAFLIGTGSSKPNLMVDGAAGFSGNVSVGGGEVSKFDTTNNERTFTTERTSVDGAVNLLMGTDQEFDSLAAAAYATASSSWGNSEYITAAEFSFNTASEYGTTNQFALFETHWQTKYRIAGAPTWEEPKVTSSKGDSYPWPGRGAWDATGTYGRMNVSDLNNLDISTDLGKPHDREETKGAQPDLTGSFVGRYTVNIQLGST